MPDLTPLPPIADQPISVILLVRNEQPHLEAVVADWSALLDGLKIDYEILLVDDGSTDGTGALAEALVRALAAVASPASSRSPEEWARPCGPRWPPPPSRSSSTPPPTASISRPT